MSRDHEDLLARAVDQMGASFEITDAEGRLVYVNRAFEDATGYRGGEALGRTPAELLRSQLHADRFFDEIWIELSEGRTWRGPLVGRRRDGGQYVQQASVTPLCGDGGVVEHLVAVKQPVRSEEAEALGQLTGRLARLDCEPDAIRERLRASQRKYRALVEWAVDGILIADFDTAHIVEANPAACALWGYSEAEFAELRGRQLHAPSERETVDQMSHDLHAQGWGIAPRIRCLRKDGTEFFGRMRIRVFDDGYHRWEVSMVQDITAELEREQALLAESRLAATGRLAAGVAHDVNNPAGYVALNLELMREEVAQLAPDVGIGRVAALQAMVADCEEGMQRIQATMQDLSSFGRLSRSSVEVVDLAELVRSAARHTQPVVRHHARLELNLATIPPCEGDANQLLRVVTNLLINAAESFPAGAVDSHWIRVELRAEDTVAVLGVRDNGRGMDSDLVDRAFEPFMSTKRGDRGSGLGLWLCREIVTSHGGRVDVESAPDVGTRVTVRLPMRVPGTVGAVVATPSPDEVARDLRVLVVDDEAPIRRVFARVLDQVGEVVAAGGGREALELLARDSNFDALVCDVMMPDLDGALFYQSLQRDHPDLVERVLFCTAGALTPRLTTFLEHVPNRVLQKPVSATAMRGAVRAVATR